MRPRILVQSRRPEHKRVVFRELLQNSDDASSKAVEIRFETKKYIDGNPSAQTKAPPFLSERLPDLKTALVRGFSFPPCLVA